MVSLNPVTLLWKTNVSVFRQGLHINFARKQCPELSICCYFYYVLLVLHGEHKIRFLYRVLIRDTNSGFRHSKKISMVQQ